MIKIGEFNKLFIKKKRDFGYFLVEDLKSIKGEEILLPFGSCDDKELEVEEEIAVFIYKDSKDRVIATCKSPLAKVGEIAYLKVVDETPVGYFVDFGLERDILVPFKELAYELQVGNSYLFYLYLDKTERITATTFIDKYLENTNKFSIGEELMGTVYGEQTNNSVMVAIQNQYRAVILKKENYMGVKQGEVVDVRVKRYYEDEKMEVTPRKKRLDEKSDLENAILLYLKINKGYMKFNDNSSPEEIKSNFKCSKNAFKRALGGLMKSGVVVQKKDGTYLQEEGPKKPTANKKGDYSSKEHNKGKNFKDKNFKDKNFKEKNFKDKNRFTKGKDTKHKETKKEDTKNKFYNKFTGK